MINTTDPTIAVIYCRDASVSYSARSDGIASQEVRCREFALMKGYDVVETFEDEAVSGRIIDRPGVLELLAYLKKHRRSKEIVVIIDEISRLARNTKTHLELRSAIAEAGGRLESPSITSNDDPDSVLMENLLAAYAEYQSPRNHDQSD